MEGAFGWTKVAIRSFHTSGSSVGLEGAGKFEVATHKPFAHKGLTGGLQ